MAKRAWWAKGAAPATKRFSHRGVKARPVIVTRELTIIEKDTILVACQVRGVGLERVNGAGKTVKVPLVTLAEKVGIEGEYFRSKREAARYIQLRRAEGDGVVRNLKRSPRFVLHVVNPAGLKVAISEYTGDFEYDEEIAPEMMAATLFGRPVGVTHVIEESKGFPTPDWELRRKWVETEYGITIRVT